jgi:hypothetical protein
MMNKSGLLVSLVLGLAASACNSSPREPKYRVDTKDASEPTGEDARLRKLQAIKVFNPDMPEGQQYSEWDISQVTFTVDQLCYARHPCYGADPIIGSDGNPHLGCADSFLRSACDLAHDTCVSEALNELAEAAVVPISLQHAAVPWHYTIPPQSEAARLAILNEVRFKSQVLAFKALALMNGYFYESINPYAWQGLGPWNELQCKFADGGPLVSGVGTQLHFQSDADDVATPDGRRVSQIVTNALIVGERLARRSAFTAADKTVAVAEWDRGTAGSFSGAQERAFSRAQLSRSAAAHILAGGSPGLRVATSIDSTTGKVPTAPAFCLAQPLSSGGQRALQAFRETGIAPAAVLSGANTEALVSGPLDSGSVAERLPFLRVGAAPSPYDEYAASVADFKEARAYLAEEISAFNRTKVATFDQLGPFPRYAGTSNKPPRRPDEFYSAIARQESAPPPWNTLTIRHSPGQGVSLSNFEYGEAIEPNSLAGFYADLGTWLNDTLKYYSTVATPASGEQLGPDINADIRPAALLLQRVLDESKAILQGKYENCPATDCWRSILLVATKPYQTVSLVSGEDGLACALNTTVEGGSCAGIGAVTTVLSSAPPYYLTAGYSMVLSSSTTFNPLTERSYLYGTSADGKKELIGSLPALNLQPGNEGAWPVNFSYAVMPDIEAKVAEYLRPSADWCAHADVECNGQKYDARLPLENELDDNNDGVENSWKYYLSRAESAAAQADQLGQEYLNASLTAQRDEIEGQRAAVAQRTQVDAELETLQQTCGLSASVDELLHLFGQDGNLEQLLTDSQCTSTGDCGDLGRQCIGGRCLLVPKTLVGAQDGATVLNRLATCLGVDSVMPQVVVGDHPVCIHSDGDPCHASDAYCPIPVPKDSTPSSFCTGLSATLSGTWVPLTEQLKYIQVPDDIAYTNFSRLAAQTGPGNSGACRYTKPLLTGEWFKLTEWTNWVTNNLCDSQAPPPNCVPTANCNTPPPGKSATQAYYSFPFFDPPTAADGSNWGKALEITKCPAEVKIDDLTGLTPEMQVYLLKNAIECNYSQLLTGLGTRILTDLPQGVLEVLRQQGPLAKFSNSGGDYGQAVADLRSNILSRTDATRAMTTELQGMVEDIDTYQADIKFLGFRGQELALESNKLDLQKSLNDLRLNYLEYQTDFAAISGAVGIVSAAASANGFAMMGSVLGSAEKISYLGFQEEIARLEGELIELEKKQVNVQKERTAFEAIRDLHRTRVALGRRLTAIQGYADQIRSALEDWSARLYAIESLRNKASRALSRAIAAASNQLADQEKRLVHSSSNLAQLQKIRYDEAFRSAVGLSFLAKRAIETRLGKHFSEMTEKLPLLNSPPATWENEICVASGLDYNQLVTGDSASLPKGALNGFLGTYVNKLQNVVDAYQLQYAFREGGDVMTISLKDDVFRARATCTGPSGNLLKETVSPAVLGPSGAGPLTATPTPPPLDLLNSSAWVQPGCASYNCIWIGETSDGVGDFGVLPETRPFLIYAKGAPMSQNVLLDTGDYVLSWYQAGGRPGSDIRLFDPTQNVTVEPQLTDSYASHVHAGREWTRNVRGYHLTQKSTLRVDIVPGAGTATQYDWVEVGAIMLEKVAPGSDYHPADYQVSDSQANAAVPCADTDGSVFRDEYWRHDCESVCVKQTGLCADGERVQRCYWETSFPITVKDIEYGRVLRNSGFALGNYNYRIEDLALNVVGSGLRNCSASGNLSCYATAYVPFSLSHLGPFSVRNHTGADSPVNIFDGKIEWAKALAAERYLTNPLSATDDSLLKQYLRQEFRGRPLDGNYVIRIWDDAEFDFEKVQDVQLLLRYRYWTAAQ